MWEEPLLHNEKFMMSLWQARKRRRLGSAYRTHIGPMRTYETNTVHADLSDEAFLRNPNHL
jgi:hypothetical protein